MSLPLLLRSSRAQSKDSQATGADHGEQWHQGSDGKCVGLIVIRGRMAAFMVLLSLSCYGCSLSGLQFETDNRLSIISPHQGELVGMPLTLRWAVKNFTIDREGPGPGKRDSEYFAIFVDRAPVRPGQTLRAVASNDYQCLHTPGCPNTTYLADRGVFTTAATSFTLTSVARLNNYQNVQLHEAVIVLMNSAGQRIGESAWYIDFRLHKAPT